MSSTSNNNPCLACKVDQQCCSKLSGLRLSKKEYEKYFQILADRLTVVEHDKMFIVSVPDKGPCPYWEQDGCRIYSARPIDCRVYPYEIIEIREQKKFIEIKFRDSPSCPQTDELKMPVEKAKMLMKQLGQAAYGYSKPIVIIDAEDKVERTGILRRFNQIMSRFREILR